MNEIPIEYYLDKCKGLRDWLDLWLDEYTVFKKIDRVFWFYEQTGILLPQYVIPLCLPFDEWWILNYRAYTKEYFG